MPTIEFHGYTPAELASMAERVTERVRGTEFAAEIVLVTDRPDTVCDLDGRSRPFLRILTRSTERAATLRRQLNALADLEIVPIEFFERTSR